MQSEVLSKHVELEASSLVLSYKGSSNKKQDKQCHHHVKNNVHIITIQQT